jgi:ATP-dependent Clp protease ATP-binding subunit ClpA
MAVSDRLPDSAIDLIDEACSITKIGTNANWEQLGRLKRRQIAIEMDIQSLEVSPHKPIPHDWLLNSPILSHSPNLNITPCSDYVKHAFS